MHTIVKECQLRDGETVLLEVHPIRPEGEETDAGVKERTLEYFNETWETLRPALAAMMGQLKELGPERERFTPCGACMDWVFELGGSDCRVGYQSKRAGEMHVVTAGELMPYYPH